MKVQPLNHYRSALRWVSLLGIASVLFACQQIQPSVDSTQIPPKTIGAPPWQQRLDFDQIAPVYLTEWQKAENRRNCALMVLPKNSSAQVAGASVRRAEFSGGWAVAYDTPEMRSAYGVAGTGVLIGADDTYTWPKYQSWTDGSRMGYGLEGGSGPKYLAYVWVAGQGCLYNVWSGLGEAHLLQVVDGLRRAN